MRCVKYGKWSTLLSTFPFSLQASLLLHHTEGLGERHVTGGADAVVVLSLIMEGF